ncbi:unnamed protein product [Paramecium sonneborni]|uniref:G domain-containing protein n=1 Tax=Paramecium sonneborni TaxID=65129 RepID=A0A8S1PAQ9_9CILI|nr:unnamed protein product [Paramecium sonneborni]
MDQHQLEKENGEKQQRLLKIIDKVESQLETFSRYNLENLIMLVGKTGSGKSTIYNFLCGAQFSLIIDDYGKPTLKLVNESDQFQEIRGGLDSTTKTPKIYYEQKYKHSIIDYPGFNDTEINDQLEIQLLFNKLVTQCKIKIVYVFLNPGDDLQNKAEDLQNFINEADIDISKLTILINSYSKKRTDDQLIAGFQQEFMKKFNKKAHQLIIQRDIDKPKKISQFLSEEYRQKMWKELISSQVIQMKPCVLSTYQDVNNYLDNISLDLSESLLLIFKELQYKQYSTQQIEEIKENIKKLENTQIIIQRFQEGNISKLNELMMFTGTFQENQMIAISRIYSFFLDCKNQMEAYTKMEKCIQKALQNLELSKEYLCLKQTFLEQLKLAEDTKNQLEEEKQLIKKEKGKMEDKIRIKEDELIQLKELLVQAQQTQNQNKDFSFLKNNTEQEIKLIKDQAIQEVKRLNKEKTQKEQELSDFKMKNISIEMKCTQLQNEKNIIIEELQSVKNQNNEKLIDLKIKELEIKAIQLENKQALDQIQKLEQQLKEIKNNSLEQSRQYEEMKYKFKTLKKENIEIKTLINDKQLQLDLVQNQNTVQINQLKNIQQELNETKDQKQKIMQSFQEIQNKYQEMKEGLEQQKIKNLEIQQKLNNKEHEFKEKNFYYQQVCLELNDIRAKFQIQEEQYKQLLKSIKTKEDELKKKDEELTKQLNENRLKEQNIQKYNLECNNAKSELQNTLNDMNQQSLKLQQVQEENKIQNTKLLQYEQKQRDFQTFLEQIQYGSNNLEKVKFNSVIVLIGMIGSGRTTLFNKICKSQEKVKAGGSSSTRQSILGKSAYGHEFFVIDTPGLGSDQDKINHAIGILNAVQDQPLNKIILAVKFDNFAIMINQLLIQMKIFQRYQKMFTVFVTHFDQSKNKENDKIAIKKEVEKIGIQSILFFQIIDNAQSICDQINTLLNQTIPRKVEITQEEFLKYFDLFDDDELNDSDDYFRIEEKKAFINSKIKKMIFSSSNYSMQKIQQSNKPDEMYDIVLKELKINAQKIIKEEGPKIFSLKKVSSINLEQQETLTTQWFDSVENMLSYQLQKELLFDIKQFNQQALQQLSSNKDSIINNLKICNYCGLIWYFQSNCNNTYYCNGDFKQRNNSPLDEFFWAVFQFIINISGISNLEIQRIKQIILLHLRERYDQNNYYGCNNQLESISKNKNTFEFFDFNLDFLIQPNQFFQEQSKYKILDQLIQKKKKILIVKRLQNQQSN